MEARHIRDKTGSRYQLNTLCGITAINATSLIITNKWKNAVWNVSVDGNQNKPTCETCILLHWIDPSKTYVHYMCDSTLRRESWYSLNPSSYGIEFK